jgi:hypothetical protein
MTAKNKQRRRTDNGKSEEQTTTKKKNKQKRNAGVPPLRYAPVGMTALCCALEIRGRDDGVKQTTARATSTARTRANTEILAAPE